MGEHKSRGLDAKRRRLEDELAFLFLNELTDDRLAGVEFTGCQLSSDLRHLAVFYLPRPGGEEDAAAAITGVEPLVEDRAFETLHRRPAVRFKFDRGAANERRVGQLLEELRAEGELPGNEADRD